MRMTRSLTAILIREGDGFVALCPEVDVASQGDTVEKAKRNLREAVELFFECASAEEIAARLSTESFVSSLEVAVA
jgi:predicted RNase H-like HicB family nuclease